LSKIAEAFPDCLTASRAYGASKEIDHVEIQMNYLARQKKLAAAVRNAGLDALLITHLPNVMYLCGFTGSAGVLLLQVSDRAHKTSFYTDGRYTQQAHEEVRNAKVVIGKRSAFVEACGASHNVKVKTLGFEAEQMPFVAYKELGKMLRDKARLKPTFGMVEQLRLIKDADEISQIRASVLVAASLFQTALSVIKPGVVETQVAGELELQARRAGAEKMSFDTIVAAGTRSALPHGRASTQAIPNQGFIILDYGVILAGYCSDMTRTVHTGPVSRSHRRMYEAVREAQMASMNVVKPGVETGEVDRAGREVLKKTGFDRYFTHSTGHGVGIEIHEQPRLATGQTQKLAPGMVVTIEPGIYIPGDGGVRIEDMVLVTETGHEVLTPTTKDLITL
jgi:Xaa-Pro aminopeptidase